MALPKISSRHSGASAWRRSRRPCTSAAPDRTFEMSAHEVKLFGDQIAASRMEGKFALLKAETLLRLAIKDLFPGRIALVSSFGAESAVLLHMVAEIDKATPIVFADTGQLFPETLEYRDKLCALLGLTNVIVATPDEETLLEEDPEK